MWMNIVVIERDALDWSAKKLVESHGKSTHWRWLCDGHISFVSVNLVSHDDMGLLALFTLKIRQVALPAGIGWSAHGPADEFPMAPMGE